MRFPLIIGLILLLLASSFKDRELSAINFKSKSWQKHWAPVKDGLWMQKTEVSNLDYKLFLNALKAAGKDEEYEFFYPDTLGWLLGNIANRPYTSFYFSSPSFNNFPLVNITYEAAYDYCQWLTAEYDKLEKKPFGKVVFQIPSREDWMYAARGGKADDRSYPWGGMYLYNNRKQRLCNFNFKIDDSIRTAVDAGPYSYNVPSNVTAPVNSFFPNDLGLFNVCGNVAEMVSERGTAVGGSYLDGGQKVRIESTKQFEKSAPDIGFRVVMVKVDGN